MYNEMNTFWSLIQETEKGNCVWTQTLTDTGDVQYTCTRKKKKRTWTFIFQEFKKEEITYWRLTCLSPYPEKVKLWAIDMGEHFPGLFNYGKILMSLILNRCAA